VKKNLNTYSAILSFLKILNLILKNNYYKTCFVELMLEFLYERCKPLGIMKVSMVLPDPCTGDPPIGFDDAETYKPSPTDVKFKIGG